MNSCWPKKKPRRANEMRWPPSGAACRWSPSLQAYAQRMGWTIPWVSSEGNSFNRDFGLTTNEGETFGLSAFVRDGSRVFRSYFTAGRGVETLGPAWTFLDLTPFGRQETWEDSPAGWPQTPPYEWWRRHDEYGS